jgi:hypothetical protein
MPAARLEAERARCAIKIQSSKKEFLILNFEFIILNLSVIVWRGAEGEVFLL